MLLEAFLSFHPIVFFIIGIVELLYGLAILLRVNTFSFLLRVEWMVSIEPGFWFWCKRELIELFVGEQWDSWRIASADYQYFFFHWALFIRLCIFLRDLYLDVWIEWTPSFQSFCILFSPEIPELSFCDCFLHVYLQPSLYSCTTARIVIHAPW